jgi:DNA-binding transcriptional ArsR family regulator
MANRSRSPAAANDSAGQRRDLIFALLADPVRRRILELLSDGKPHSATSCARHVRRRLDAALKHLIALREARVITTRADPVDCRRQLYTLSEQIPVRKSESGTVEMDFGCCLLRL